MKFLIILSILLRIAQSQNWENIYRRNPIPDDNNDNPYGWRNHVDFDELHPGEDQIAIESRRSNSRGRNFGPFGEESDENIDIISVPVQRVWGGNGGYTDYPDASQNARLEPSNSNRPWWPHPYFRNVKPWWKSPNVCIKREEEDTKGLRNDETNLQEREEERNFTSEHPSFRMRFSTCDILDTRFTCITRLIGPHIEKVITTNYECCDGYYLNAHGRQCIRGRFKNLADTMEELGGREFMRLVKLIGLENKLINESLTIFVPNDDSINLYMNDRASNIIPITLEEGTKRRRRNIFMNLEAPDNERENQINSQSSLDSFLKENKNEKLLLKGSTETVPSNSDDDEDWRLNTLEEQDKWRSQYVTEDPSSNQNLQQTLLGHMLTGKITTDDFVDEKVLFSENPESSIRFNTWDVNGEKLKTVNCARLTSVNNKCTNGMIHMVDRMFSPIKKSIADILENEPELSIIYSLLRVNGKFLRMFQDNKGLQGLTFFAPTNKALNKLEPSLLNRLKNGDPCLERILKHHIIPITLCSTVIFNRGVIRNLNHEMMEIFRNTEDVLSLNGSDIITKDIMATNGVVNIIDTVLMTDNDKPIGFETLKNAGFTSFAENLSKVGLLDTVNNLNNVTIFAPTNAAFEELPEEVKNNSEKLKEILLYHIASPSTRACYFSHEQEMKTLESNKTIRINIYSMSPLGNQADVTANCIRLTQVNKVGCNGVIHTVEKILIPSDLNLYETLGTQSDFSIFIRLLAVTDLIEILKSSNPHTIFIPTDDAFYSLPREDLEKILNDKEEATALLKRHITEGTICCAGIGPNMWFLTKIAETLSEVPMPIYRNFKGDIIFGKAKVTSCDLTASNGVIHTIDTVLVNPKNQLRNGLMERCLPKKPWMP